MFEGMLVGMSWCACLGPSRTHSASSGHPYKKSEYIPPARQKSINGPASDLGCPGKIIQLFPDNPTYSLEHLDSEQNFFRYAIGMD